MTASIDFAGLGGQHQLHQADHRGRLFLASEPPVLARHARRAQVRPAARRIRASCRSSSGCSSAGEYTIRGFDLRTIGPSDPYTGLVLGGNKSLLFNVEQIVTIAGPVRLIFFFDAGQVRNFGERFGWTQTLVTPRAPAPPLVIDPLTPPTFTCTDPWRQPPRR